GQTAPRTEPATYRFSVAVRPPRTLPPALNGFGLWLGLMVALTIVNYGFPIAHSLATPGTAGPPGQAGEGWGPPEESSLFAINGSPEVSGSPRRSRSPRLLWASCGCRFTTPASASKVSGTRSAVPRASFGTYLPARKSSAPIT